MDRLLAGDVGFGKTEVAMRAIFKAVMSGKQVAVLVPTTVLAQQHFQTFLNRFAPFGVKVDVLNRFRSTAEKKQVLKGVEDPVGARLMFSSVPIRYLTKRLSLKT